jgi:phosphoserine phosphatase
MNIIIVRHGETAWNREGRYQGRTDIPLSPTGEGQAAALGQRLHDVAIDRAVASPLARAKRTAQLALGDRADMLTLDEDLLEISHGAWEGKLASEIEQSDPEMLRRWRHHPSATQPAGPDMERTSGRWGAGRAETLADVTQRAWRALQRATLGLLPEQTLLLVAHDAVNRALICKIIGLPIEQVWSFQQSPATVNALTGDTIDSLQLVRLNDAAHHSGLFSAAAHKAL